MLYNNKKSFRSVKKIIYVSEPVLMLKKFNLQYQADLLNYSFQEEHLMKGEIEIKVRGYHVDIYSHVNNARYMEFLEEARWAIAENHPFTEEIMKRGYAFPLVNVNISYLNEAGMGDILVVQTGLKSAGNKSITLSQKIFRKSDGKQVVDADVTFVLLDIKKGKAVELDDNMKKLLL